MQHGVQHLGEWLRREWMVGVIIAVNGFNARRATRLGRLSLRERVAIDWPAIEGVARCRIAVPTGMRQGAVHMRAVPADGSELVYWEHAFSTRAEARHYAEALDGQIVRIHVNPEKPEERIVCWAEIRRVAPAFVRPDGGRMSAAAFRWVRGFQAAVLGVAALFATDLGLFATPWGRNAEWHGMCLCDLSVSLLVASMVLLLPGMALRGRMEAVSLEEDGGRLRRVSRWVYIVSIGAWAGMLMFAAWTHGDTPDAVFYGLITLPVFPLLWSSAVVAARAERRLRPSRAQNMQQPAVQMRPQTAERAGLVEAG